jgi:hypothetical protein
MNRNTLPRHTFEFVLILSTLLIGTLACSMGGVDVRNGTATLNLTLTESQVNENLSKATENYEKDPDHLFQSVDHVEFHDGYIRVFGTALQPSGEEVSGSFDVSFSAKDGLLDMQITAIDMSGIELTDPRVERYNDYIYKAMNDMIEESKGQAYYEDASVNKDGLTLKLRFTPDKP